MSKSNSNQKLKRGNDCNTNSNSNNRRANGLVVTTTTSPNVNHYKHSNRATRQNVCEQPVTVGNCSKKGRNWKKVNNYAFRSNNAGYCNSTCNRQNLLLSSKDNCFASKIATNKTKGVNGVVKGIKIDGFGKIVNNGKGTNEVYELRKYFYKGNNMNANINGNKAYTERYRKK